MRAKDSNGTTVGKFSIFNLLRGRFTLLPSSLCAPEQTHRQEVVLVSKNIAEYCYGSPEYLCDVRDDMPDVYVRIRDDMPGVYVSGIICLV